MKLSILRNEEWATALKEAIKMRREGTIDRATDDQLGLFAYNIAQWAIASSVQKGQLWIEFSQDIDFQGDVLVKVVEYLDKVNLDREPKEILVYLYRVARSAIRDLVDKANTGKRKHEEACIEGATIVTDFYGRPSGTGFGRDPVDRNVSSQSCANLMRYGNIDLSTTI